MYYEQLAAIHITYIYSKFAFYLKPFRYIINRTIVSLRLYVEKFVRRLNSIAGFVVLRK